jgi:transposase
VTVEHVAGIPVRHPDMVALGRHYGAVVQTCGPCDPESNGGTEATVKITKANLLPDYSGFGELEEDCQAWCTRVSARMHRESAAIPDHRLAAERQHLHPLPRIRMFWPWARNGW